MENNYLIRAKEIFDRNITEDFILTSGYKDKEDFFNDPKNKDSFELTYKMLIQIAEEVEKNTKKLYVDFIQTMTNGILFTRERVEELLEKQRELSNTVHEDEILINMNDILEKYCEYNSMRILYEFKWFCLNTRGLDKTTLLLDKSGFIIHTFTSIEKLEMFFKSFE